MKTFLITTEVTFINKYFIDAETVEEAEDIAANNSDEHEYLQLFVGEEVIDSTDQFEPTTIIEDLRAEGYF
jgi:hypothetical protein